MGINMDTYTTHIAHGGSYSIPSCDICTPIPTSKEKAMHYKLTLTPRTTMVWLVVFTLNTLLSMVPMFFTNEGQGIYTLSSLMMIMSVMFTLTMGGIHAWVRKNYSITISTRNMYPCTHCTKVHPATTPFECKHGVDEAEYYGL